MAKAFRMRWRVVAGLLIATVVTGWIWRQDVARLGATWVLDRSGVGPASLTVGAIDLGGLHARDISLFGGAVRVAALTLSYDPRQLITGVLREATITRPRVVLGMTEAGLEVGGFSLDASGTSGGPSFLDGIRIDALRIVDARVVLTTPTGPLEAVFSTALAVAGTKVTGTALSADITVPRAGSMRVDAPTIALSLADGGGRLGFSGVAVRPSDLPWSMDGLDGTFAWHAGRLDGAVTAARVASTESPAVVSPVQLTAEASMDGPRIEFALRGILGPPSGPMRLAASGHHDRASGKGTSSITVGPVVFRAGNPRPRDLFPILGDVVPDVSGSLGLSGSVAWDGTTVTPALVLRLADGLYEPKGLRLSSIRGNIALSGLWPVTTRASQVITGIVEAGGLPPIRTSLTFQLLPKPALRIESSRMEFLGGRITTSPFVVDPAKPTLDTTIALRQVDLGEFFKLVGVDGLGGTGRLDGTVPLSVGNGTVVIRDGHLAATEPGVIRLDSGSLPKQITEAGESMTLVLQALADFHYDSLTIDLSGSPAGDGTVLLKLQGKNPNLLDGRPFHINIRFESKFDRLVEIALRSMEAAQAVLRRTTGSARR